MKIDNLFVRHHLSTDDWERELILPAAVAPLAPQNLLGTKGEAERAARWKCTNDIVILDFGFSCIACGKGFLRPRATLIGAGSWYKMADDCMKHGRDLGMFLYSLHCAFPLSSYVSGALFDILHRAALAEIDGHAVDMFMGLDERGNPATGTSLPQSIAFNNGIYHFLNNPNLDVPRCRPAQFMKDLFVYAGARA